MENIDDHILNIRFIDIILMYIFGICD